MHSFERLFYENPAFWLPERYEMLETERAHLTRQWIPAGTESALDVGCGNGVLTNQLAGLASVVGLDRSFTALWHVQVPRCQADVVHLPFANETFDVVIATEVIEHLTFPVLTRALAEMVRIARRNILITVPYNEEIDLARVTCPECGCRFHPTWHMRSYDLAALENLFTSWNSIALVRVSGIFSTRVPVYMKERMAIGRKITRRKEQFPWFALCPQCGYAANESSSPRRANHAERQENNNGRLKQIIKAIWPKRNAYRWWIALYAKVETR